TRCYRDWSSDVCSSDLYAHLSRRAGSGVAWPAITSIARVCKLSRNTVIGALASLQRRGLLQVERGGRGMSNRYRLVEIGGWVKKSEERRVGGGVREPSV